MGGELAYCPHLPSNCLLVTDTAKGEGQACLYRLNKCGVISPRYDVKHMDIEAWVARLLPSRLVGSIAYTASEP